MGADIRKDGNGFWVLQISGSLRKAELDAVQATAISNAAPGETARLLIIVDGDFSGWVGTEEWNDSSFFLEHGDRIVKIAIVGDPSWEEEMLIFTGAGLRRAPVKYFSSAHRAEAEEWLI
jgi:hypothetical protein